jgi:hypothetical protein
VTLTRCLVNELCTGQSYELLAGKTKNSISTDESLSLESCEEGDWIYLAQFRNRRRGAVLCCAYGSGPVG